MIKPKDVPFDDGTVPDQTDFPLDEFEVDYVTENPPQEEIIRLCEEFFSPSGPLMTSGLAGGKAEERPQQRQMASAIAHALVSGENLCIEAPTGVGKSFAYLVPLIFRSRSRMSLCR